MELFISIIIIIMTFAAFILPSILFYNLLKNKEAALSLIFNKIDKSIIVFKMFAVAMLVFSVGRLLDLLNITLESTLVDDTATVLNLLTTVILIFVYYKLLNIIKIKDQEL